jgi:zinc/manganese transport system permease protein
MTKFTWTWWSWNLVGDLRQMFLYPFMVNLFEAGTMIAILAGIVSYLVVIRRSSFAAHALGHLGFSGAAGAVLFAVNPFYGLLIATTAAGSGIAVLGEKASHRDVEIGTVLAFALGLGLLFLAFYNGYSTQAYSILFGQVVGITPAQVQLTLYTSIPTLGVLLLLFRPLLFASLDEEVAAAKGMPTTLLGVVFMVSLAVVISIAVTVIGVLLIFALTVTPAAIAIRLVRRPIYAVTLSVLLALFAVWAGAFIAFYESPEPTSFFIVTIMFAMYVIVRALPGLGRLRDRVAKRLGRAQVLPTAPRPGSVPEPADPTAANPVHAAEDAETA